MAECCVLLNKRRKRPLDRFEWAAHMCGSRNEAWTMLKLQRHGGDVAAAFTLQDPEISSCCSKPTDGPQLQTEFHEPSGAEIDVSAGECVSRY